MELSYFLAAVIGWYLVILAVFILFRYTVFEDVAKGLISHQPSLFITSLIALIFGLLIVISHNIWVFGWPVIITIIGWLAVIKGLFRLFFPEKTKELGLKWLNHKSYSTITGIVLLLLGACLLLNAYIPYFM